MWGQAWEQISEETPPGMPWVSLQVFLVVLLLVLQVELADQVQAEPVQVY